MQLLQPRRAPAPRRDDNNGGFPEPPADEPVRVVRRAHAACGAETRIRIPAALPERAVRRVVCGGCRQSYATGPGEVRAAPPAPPAAETAAYFAGAATAPNGGPAAAATEPALDAARSPTPAAPAGGPRENLDAVAERLSAWAELVRDRAAGLRPARRQAPGQRTHNRLWAWISVPVALVAVLVGLSLIQGDSSVPAPVASGGPGVAETARFVEQPGYSLALPAGWQRSNPPGGAVFAASSEDGNADATLWIEEDPELTMKQFERRSLQQLAEIGENARVVDRVDAPTLEGTIVELRAETPVADGVTAPYRVTLRGAGPFRHYLATSQRPGGAAGAAADIELLHTSLRPQVELGEVGGE